MTIPNTQSTGGSSPPRDRPPDRMTIDVRDIARNERERFAGGYRMRVGRNRTVHAVMLAKWIAGEYVPKPLCHAPTFGDTHRFNRTFEPVTCTNCRRKMAHPSETVLPHGTVQPELFDAAALSGAA